ncbi:hypothetical protein Ahy_A08g040711 isoform E [Arachis hypogaea]|uniref:ATP-dependent DNA helicase PIF1 n=2 Tax=Arachis hypogaea TaxID=3818 RepID=A0A445C071_ARAHY|nr:hypothetical protein Ahy_A08g040711 isoform E [Arachis hypogaea]
MRLKVEDQASTFMASLVIGFLSKRKNIPLLQITSDLLLFILPMDDYLPSADLIGGSIILQDTPIINANFILSGCLDIGDPVYTCLYCGASFWLLERVEKQSRINQPLFTLCCFQGKIQLPYLQKAPDLLYNLIHGHDSKSLQFQKKIRYYNSMFAFTSLGGKVIDSVNDGTGPPQFIISGQNYHRIGSLLPQAGQVPKFAQLYIYDIEHELTHRERIFG